MFRQAVTSDPDEPDYHFNLAVSLKRHGNGPEALGELSQCLKFRPNDSEAQALVGVDYWQMVSEGPAELLAQTVNTQPLMLVTGVACWRAWREQGGPMPAYFAGHSLGEYSALVAAGGLSLADAVTTVRQRGKYMQEAVPVGAGAMAAIMGADLKTVMEACGEAQEGDDPGRTGLGVIQGVGGQHEAADPGAQVEKRPAQGVVQADPMGVAIEVLRRPVEFGNTEQRVMRTRQAIQRE